LLLQTDTRVKTHRIRPASADDAAAIAEIYAWYVEHSAATFDEVAPTAAEHAAKIDAASLPFLVAVDAAGAVAGYAYLAPYRPRSAYRFTAEITIYVASEARGSGIGSALIANVLRLGVERGIREVIAVITATDDGESLAFHARHGFVVAGRLRAVGFKHDRWYDTVFMQWSHHE